MAPQSSQWDGSVRPRRGDRPSGARLDRLLRGLLPLRAVLPRTAHQRASRSMGHAEIQTTTRKSCQGSGLAGRGSTAPAPALRPLAPSPAHPRPARGSRMTGDCHVRFCESRGVRFPPATHQDPGDHHMARRPSALPHAPHPDLHLLAQPGRAVVRATDRQATPPRRPPLSPGPRDKTFATGSPPGTTTPNPSPGPRPPTKSSNASPHIFNEFPVQDTSPTTAYGTGPRHRQAWPIPAISLRRVPPRRPRRPSRRRRRPTGPQATPRVPPADR